MATEMGDSPHFIRGLRRCTHQCPSIRRPPSRRRGCHSADPASTYVRCFRYGWRGGVSTVTEVLPTAISRPDVGVLPDLCTWPYADSLGRELESGGVRGAGDGTGNGNGNGSDNDDKNKEQEQEEEQQSNKNTTNNTNTTNTTNNTNNTNNAPRRWRRHGRWRWRQPARCAA